MTLAALTLAACTYMFFDPGREFTPGPNALALTPTDIYFRSPDGLMLHGWHFGHQGTEQRGVILICHGNIENLSTHAELDLWLVRAGYDVFIFDYRGYGRSEGSPTVEGIHLDAGAALEALLNMPGNEDARITVYGKSLGGAVAVYLTANSPHRRRISHLIIEGTFADYRLMARQEIQKTPTGIVVMYPLSLLVDNQYSPLRWIARVHPIPTLIIHGTEDDIVPPEHGRLLYEAAREPRQLWELKGLGHVKSWTHAQTRDRLLQYLAQPSVEPTAPVAP